MATKIRLARGGAKKRPFYRVVVADALAPRDGRFIEKLGTFNPMLAKDNKDRVQLNNERVEHWIGQGAIPSDKVLTFINAEKICQDAKIVKKLNKKRAATIELKREEIAAKKAAEEAEAKRIAAEKAAAEADAKAAEEAAAAEAKAAEEAAAAEAEAAPAEEAEAPAEEEKEAAPAA